MSSPINRNSEAGLTLVETTIALALVSLAIIGILGFVNRASSFVGQASGSVVVEMSKRAGLTGLIDVIEESSSRFIDTTMRSVGDSEPDDSSDRFSVPASALRQCPSASCSSRSLPGASDDDRVFAGFEYSGWPFTRTATRGKIWPAAVEQCPLENSTLVSTVTLDCMKLFTARTADGEFGITPGPESEPAWNGLVIIAPYCGPRGAQLRRYDIHTSNLLSGTVSRSLAWDRFPPNDPSMIVLFDFGTDGTEDGQPDGSVPVTPEMTDAEVDIFQITEVGGEPYVIIAKSLRVGLLGNIRRELRLTLRLRDGRCAFNVSHQDSTLKWWQASATFTTTPRTLVTDLTELAISTARSNPYDEVSNPRGVKDHGVVRITLGTTRHVKNADESNFVSSFGTFSLRPRN